MTKPSLYIDKDGQEWIFDYSEERALSNCVCKHDFIKLPPGSIFKLIGRHPITNHIYNLTHHGNYKKGTHSVPVT